MFQTEMSEVEIPLLQLLNYKQKVIRMQGFVEYYCSNWKELVNKVTYMVFKTGPDRLVRLG